LRASQYEICAGSGHVTGSLGQGISAAVGMAIAGKLDKKDYYVYVILGDGECRKDKSGRRLCRLPLQA